MQVLEGLIATIRPFQSVLVGYSGGVDSTLVAVAARTALGRESVLAVIGRSASYPEEQRAAAEGIAARFDLPLVALDTHELTNPAYLANPTNRCFYCKSELWTHLGALALERGFRVVCDGTNADDLHEHRPGYAAGRQAGIRSPLAEAGLTKADVRAAARALGLPNWDAPAAPCLSSRVQYGIAITPQRLQQVEAGEACLRGLGVTGNVRVRHRGTTASVEVDPEWVGWVEERREAVTSQLQALGFASVQIDPRGYRRGSLMLDTKDA
ncbi:MAG TPA: ATP-dependent sacrificial sulfur transferase LarE [Gemmatimonadales bacterium]|nr:ATP-dependent sacrificial sulfur transferase LarE [Gemmatimonadales bacterium]